MKNSRIILGVLGSLITVLGIAGTVALNLGFTGVYAILAGAAMLVVTVDDLIDGTIPLTADGITSTIKSVVSDIETVKSAVPVAKAEVQSTVQAAKS